MDSVALEVKETQNPVPEDEFERVLDLIDYDLDYLELEDQFRDLTRLASKVAGASVSLINLIDSFTQWSVSSTGISIKQMPREESVCQYTIMGDQPFEVSDLRKDERFRERDYVVSGPKLSYYFGVPITSPDGHNLGALCVLDTEQKQLTPEKVELLEIIADEIVNRLKQIKAIKELQNQLEESNEINRKVSHDIRGPISGIIGVADMIREKLDRQEVSDILELMDLIEQGGQSILELADSILSENDTGEEEPTGRPPRPSEFNLETLQEKLFSLFEPQAMAKGVKLDISVEDDYRSVPFSKKKILQIAGNLISNAIKFTPEGGSVTAELSLIRTDTREPDQLRIIVHDTGVGISREKIEDILNGKANSTNGTEGESGYGFGLSLVHHLVSKLDGDLGIESEPDEGSRFEILLPLKVSDV